MGHDRRTFLRRAIGLGGGTAAVGLAGCLGDGSGIELPGGDGATRPDGEPPALRRGVQLGVLFTGPGGLPSRPAVDPDEPDGGRLVTVDEVAPGRRVTVSWRGTVERERPRTPTDDVGVGTGTPTPRVEAVERTGTLTARGLDDAHEPLLPMFWEQGTTTTDTSAMWLSREAYRELVNTRETRWSADPLTRVSWVGTEVRDRIQRGVDAVDEVTLQAGADFAEFGLDVDGRRTTVRGIEAHDSFGNEYVVLADEANPLVVAFTYDAVSVGFTGFDTALWTLIKAVFSGYRVVSLRTP